MTESLKQVVSVEVPAKVSLNAYLLTHLRRITMGKSYIAEIDGLRFLAIATTLIYHVYQFTLLLPNPTHPGKALYWILRCGDVGVPLFFIISGFVLGLPFAAHYLAAGSKVPLNKFYMRRVTRLEPPYVLSLAGFYFLRTLFKSIQNLTGPGHLISGLFYSHWIFYGRFTGDGNPINMVAWSLEIEILFYLFVPAIALVFAIANPLIRRGTILGFIVLSIVAQYIASATLGVTGMHLWELSIAGWLHFFLIGLLFAEIYLDSASGVRDHKLAWDILFPLACAGVIVAYGSPVLKAALLPIALSAMFIAGMSGTLTSRFLRLPWIATIGGMCYSIYLLHFGILRLFTRKIDFMVPRTGHFGVDFLMHSLIWIPIVLALSVVFYVLVERPCMDPKWPSKLRDAVIAKFEKPPLDAQSNAASAGGS